MGVRADRGYTLVEVLSAAALFGVAVAALAPVATVSVRALHSAGLRSRAVALAQAAVEDLRSLPYPDWAAMADGGDTVDAFDRTWNFLAAPGVPAGAELRRVLVTVSWAGPDGRRGRVALIAARGRE